MPKPDDFNKKPLTPNAPLMPAQDESTADLHTTRISDQTRKTAPQHTSRMPAPVMTKPKKKKKKKKTTQSAEPPHSIFKPRTQYPNFLLSVLVSTIRLSTVLTLCVCLALAGALIGIAKAYVDTAPTLDLAALDAQDKTSFIYDSKGNLITDYKGTEDRIMVSIDDIPQMLQNAFIAVEDARFFEHNGVDVKRIVGALVANITTGSSQGGSTITQQLIKMTVLSSEQSYKRKFQEAYLAMELETRYTK